jgi:hypothetical protein
LQPDTPITPNTASVVTIAAPMPVGIALPFIMKELLSFVGGKGSRQL